MTAFIIRFSRKLNKKTSQRIGLFKLIVKTCLLFSVFFTILHSNAQYYSSGQDPFNIKWHQIKTPHFHVIFPSNSDTLGLIYAHGLELVYRNQSKSMPFSPKLVPVILHTHTSLSNGEVAWAPKRVNLFSIAPQDNHQQPWNQHLIMHEYRHVVQLSKMESSVPPILRYAFGQQVTPALIALHIPLWLIEGDAVWYETESGIGSRGKNGDFNVKIKAQLMEKGLYSYGKATFGSYKDFVPNHYELGYQLCDFGYRNYSPTFWYDCIESAGKKFPGYKSFNNCIKKNTGLSEKEFYHHVLSSLKNQWENKADNPDLKSGYEDYYNQLCSAKLPDGSIIILQNSLKDITSFVKVEPSGQTKHLFYPGRMPDLVFDLKDSLLVWAETQPTRWDNENFNNIKIYNFKSQSQRTLTNKERCFSPSLSIDNKKIVSVEYNSQNQWIISIRETASGKIQNQWVFKEMQPVHPTFSSNGEDILFLGVDNTGKSLGILNTENDKITWILKGMTNDVQFPVYFKNSILFKADASERSVYFIYDWEKNEISQFKSPGFGVGKPMINGDTILYSYYTANGYRNAQCTINDFTPTTQNELFQLPDKLEKTIDFNNDSLSIAYTIEPYRRWSHLINIHSWSLPLSFRGNSNEYGIGFTLLSQNALSTSFLTTGYQYHLQENRHEMYAEYDYRGFYPYISLRTSRFDQIKSLRDANNILRNLNFSSYSIYSKIRVPWVKNHNEWNIGCYFDLGMNFQSYQLEKNSWFREYSKEYWLGNSALYCSVKKRLAFRDLQPKYGLELSGNGILQLNTKENYQIKAFQGTIYLPGVVKQHGIYLYGGVQERNDSMFLFNNTIKYPAGLEYPNHKQLTAVKTGYILPICYPDFEFYNLLYLKRIKGNFYYHFTKAVYDSKKNKVSAIGSEILFDFHLLRFIAPIEAGINYSWRPELNNHYFGFAFAINFYDI